MVDRFKTQPILPSENDSEPPCERLPLAQSKSTANVLDRDEDGKKTSIASITVFILLEFYFHSYFRLVYITYFTDLKDACEMHFYRKRDRVKAFHLIVRFVSFFCMSTTMCMSRALNTAQCYVNTHALTGGS